MHWTKCTWGLHVYTDTYTETYIRSYMQYTRITYIINTHTVSRKDLRGLLRLCRLRRLEVDYVTNSVLNELTFIRIKNQNKKPLCRPLGFSQPTCLLFKQFPVLLGRYCFSSPFDRNVLSRSLKLLSFNPGVCARLRRRDDIRY